MYIGAPMRKESMNEEISEEIDDDGINKLINVKNSKPSS